MEWLIVVLVVMSCVNFLLMLMLIRCIYDIHVNIVKLLSGNALILKAHAGTVKMLADVFEALKDERDQATDLDIEELERFLSEEMKHNVDVGNVN